MPRRWDTVSRPISGFLKTFGVLSDISKASRKWRTIFQASGVLWPAVVPCVRARRRAAMSADLMPAGSQRPWASGVWLTRGRMTFTAVAMLAGTVLALGLLFATAHGTVDRFNRPLGTDFSSFWTAGRMALDGHAALAYDWQAHWAMQRQTHGIDQFYPWSYPPVFLLVAAALAALPYVPALMVWQVTSLLAALAVFRRILPQTQALLFALGFPGVLVCFGDGQTGFLTAALLGGGVVALPRRQVLAGVLFGLLIYKPQFGIMIPFVLAAAGYWRAIAAATVTAAIFVGVTLVVWGWPVWHAFLASIPLTGSIVLDAGSTGFGKFQSIFSWVRLMGGPLPLAYGVQAVVTLAVFGACVWMWRSPISFRLKGAALLAGALLSSPYVLDYDFIVFGLALALVVAHGFEHGFNPWEKTVLALAWLSPCLDRPIGEMGFPLGFLSLATIFLLVVKRAADEGAVPLSLGRAGFCR
jgi:hypothetical protein